MVDMYQTGIIITLILLLSGNMLGVLARIDSDDPGIDLSIPVYFNSITTADGTESEMGSMIAKINEDFNSASSASNLLTQSILFGGALVNGALTIVNVIVGAFTSWFAIVDILFAFTAGTAIIVLKDPIKIILSIVMIYTLIKFLGDMISHLPLFGG